MSRRSDPWNDIEALLDEVRVEEEVQLAVLEALGELDDPEADGFSWDELLLDESPPDESPRGVFLWGEHPWGDFSNECHL